MPFGPIVRPEDCANVTSEVDPTLCNPTIRSAQIQRWAFTLLNGSEDFGVYDGTDTPPADAVDNPSAWSDRIDQTGESDGAIQILHVIGEMPEAEDEVQDIPMGNTRVLSRTHTATLFVAETSLLINELMYKWAKYGATIGSWFETSQPTLMGGSEGIHQPIQTSIGVGQVVPRERNGIHGWNVKLTWKTLGTPQIMDSPIPATPEPGAS